MKDSIEDFANRQAKRLLKKFKKEARRAAKNPDEEPIHNLRVSIRRLSQCLNEFRRFYPRHKTKKRLKRLNNLMDAAAEIRNRDIAIALIRKENARLAENLKQEREEKKEELAKALVHWRRDVSS